MSDIAFLKNAMKFKGLKYDPSKTQAENEKIFISHESGKTKKADSVSPKKTIGKTPLSARKKKEKPTDDVEDDDDEEKIAFFKTERPKLIKLGKFKTEIAIQTELKKMWEATKNESSNKGIVLPTYTELKIQLSAEEEAAMGLENIGTRGDGTFIYRPIATPSKKSPVKSEKEKKMVAEDDDDDEEEADDEGDEDDEGYEETDVIDKAQYIEFLKKHVQKHIWKSIMSDLGEKVSGTTTELIERFLNKFKEYAQADDMEDEEGDEEEEEGDGE